jgi:hypothetical protein
MEGVDVDRCKRSTDSINKYPRSTRRAKGIEGEEEEDKQRATESEEVEVPTVSQRRKQKTFRTNESRAFGLCFRSIEMLFPSKDG